MKASAKIQKMTFTVIVTVIALSLIIVLPAKAITWGWPDGNLHPNVGAIVDELGQICSGTLIYPNIFLTAGHCTDYLESLEITEIYVTFDEDPWAVTSTWLPVKAVITHPDYNWGPYSNPYDVGVLILEEPAAGIPLANLPEKGFLDDLRKAGELRKGKEEADFTVVGYGATLYWPPPKFTYESKRQYAESEYQALLKSWLRMSQNQATGDGGTAYGDSGGPAFWTDPDTGEEILVGITSWGDVPCVASGFNYRVDTSDTLKFIAKVADEWLEE